MNNTWESVKDPIRSSVGRSGMDSVNGSTSGSVWKLVGDSVWKPVRKPINDPVGHSVFWSTWGAING